ncbi:hypothetical protein CA51_51360 [Rosistilla oblonga]|uniref:SHOCT domain-containing protein n=1 Tax=Rosistilla oblonga TaxID=2527990 RepID=A0A518IU55_9BACT|nr:hypothetical protein [Rosistilla oblonga]QDV15223.1 hypothetical protein CA51_51360 [Rosistilla oblonga]QDV56626.1 hypothetical protein Mal33_26180 [Rosistilla oblonga]
MSDLFATPTAQSVFSLLILSILIAIGVWLVARFRGGTDEDREPGSEVLSNFEEMLREGDISPAEFRTIEAVVGEKLNSEAKDS